MNKDDNHGNNNKVFSNIINDKDQGKDDIFMSDEEDTYQSEDEEIDDVVRVEKGVMIIELRKGDISMSSDELECIRLQPNFQVTGDLKEEDMETELGIMGSKYRWEVSREEEERLSDEDERLITKEDRARGEEEEARSRSIFDPVKKTFSLANRRATDLRENSKVTLPRAMNAREEASLDVRMNSYRDIYKEYKKALQG